MNFMEKKSKEELQKIIGSSKIVKTRAVEEKNKNGISVFTYYCIAGDKIGGYFIYTIMDNKIVRTRGTASSGGKKPFKSVPKM